MKMAAAHQFLMYLESCRFHVRFKKVEYFLEIKEKLQTTAKH